jgi:hypothetical protein
MVDEEVLFSNPTHNRNNVIKATPLLAPLTGADDVVQTEPAYVKVIKEKT